MRGELARLRAERDALVARLSPEAYARRIVREHHHNLSNIRWLKRTAGALAIAAGISGMLLRESFDASQPLATVAGTPTPALDRRVPEAGPGELLPKGDSHFSVVRKRDAEIMMLHGSIMVQPSDQIHSDPRAQLQVRMAVLRRARANGDSKALRGR